MAALGVGVIGAGWAAGERVRAFDGEVGHWVACVATGVDSHTDVTVSYKMHEILFAADRSDIEDKPVRLPL